MNDTYRWFVNRCLKLELQIAVMKGLELAPPSHAALPPIAVRMPFAVPPVRSRQRRTTEAEIAQMRALRARGYGYNQIGRAVGFSNSTVKYHTKDVQREEQAA